MSGASATFERDARIVNARHGDVNPGEIAIGVIIGRTSEFSTSSSTPLRQSSFFPSSFFRISMR